MSKIKTKKSLIKRLRFTRSGKIMRRQSFRRHLNAGKSKKRLRRLRRKVELKGFYAKKIHKATGTNPKKIFKKRVAKKTLKGGAK